MERQFSQEKVASPAKELDDRNDQPSPLPTKRTTTSLSESGRTSFESVFSELSVPPLEAKETANDESRKRRKHSENLLDIKIIKSEMEKYLRESDFDSFMFDLFMFRVQDKLRIRSESKVNKDKDVKGYVPAQLSRNFYNSGVTKCWFCLADGSKEHLILPCRCPNPKKLIHLNCLAQYISFENICHCADCHSYFEVELSRKWSRTIEDMSKFLNLLFVMIGWIFISVLSWMFISREDIYAVFTYSISSFFASTCGSFLLLITAFTILHKYWIEWYKNLYVLSVKSYTRGSVMCKT